MLLLLTTNASSINATPAYIEKTKGSVYKSLGHFFNVKHAPEKSAELHGKLLKIQQLDTSTPPAVGVGLLTGNHSQNVVSLLFSACSSEDKSLTQREALYNQALLTIHPKSSYVWIALLGYADFLQSNINDDQRVEGLLWQAVRHSWSHVVWPTIALAHFYQYTRSEPRHGMEILLFACRSRRHYFTNNETYPENIINNLSTIATNTANLQTLHKKPVLFDTSTTTINGNDNSHEGPEDAAEGQATASGATDYIRNGVYDYDADFNEFLMKNKNQKKRLDQHDEDDNDDEFNTSHPTNNHSESNGESDDAEAAATGATLSEKEKHIEIASILSALGYCLYDLGRFDEAIAVVQAALKYIPTFTPAYRCLGLIHHTLSTYDENRKLYGTPHEGFLSGIKRGMKYASPYFLRSYSIHQLLRFENGPSLEFMHLANKLGPNSSLAWRALGFITYFYGHRNNNNSSNKSYQRQYESIQYLDCAIEASNKMDVEALKLKGQILMELGQYNDAKSTFHSALQVNPGDQISAACFAMASYAVNLVLNCEQTKRSYSTSSFNQSNNVNLTAVSSQDLLLDIHNIESLFQEALSPAALKTSLAHSLKQQHDSYEQSMTSFSGMGDDAAGGDADEGDYNYGNQKSVTGAADGNPNVQFSTKKSNNNMINIINDLNNTNGDIHYFYAMYQLKLSSYYHGSKRSSHVNLAKLFFQKVSREENDIQVLGMFMLGWIEELNQNYDDAEVFYNKAIQLYTMIEPFRFLQLIALAEEMLECVSRPEDNIHINNRKPSYNDGQNHIVGNGVSIRRLSRSGTITTQTKSKTSRKMNNTSDINNDMKIKSNYDPLSIFDYTPVMASASHNDSNNQSFDSHHYLATNQQPRRLLMHLKLVETLRDYKQQIISLSMTGSSGGSGGTSEGLGFKDLNTPSRYLSIDRQWQTKLMHSFSQCENWSWLYTCGNIID